jgi:hypothetical protein
LAFPQGTPQGISYQAVAYDSEGFEISNQDISVRLGILLGGVDAEASYTEVHSVTIDDFGLFSLVISQGETSDTFSTINWEEGAYLKVEVYEDLDGEYSVMGVSSFNAVPYALSAPTSDEVLSKILSLENFIDSLNSLGCIDVSACNFDSTKVYSDGSCQYPDSGFDCDGYVIADIGDDFQGGILFYIDETGKHGMVSAKKNYHFSFSNSYFYSWGCYLYVDEASDISIGSGYSNTLAIVNGASEINCSTDDASISGAEFCLEFENDGYDDWHLPSINELLSLYESLPFSEFDVANEGYNPFFTSSNQHTGIEYWQGFAPTSRAGYFWAINMSDGNVDILSKSSLHIVRPVRYF